MPFKTSQKNMPRNIISWVMLKFNDLLYSQNLLNGRHDDKKNIWISKKPSTNRNDAKFTKADDWEFKWILMNASREFPPWNFLYVHLSAIYITININNWNVRFSCKACACANWITLSGPDFYTLMDLSQKEFSIRHNCTIIAWLRRCRWFPCESPCR